MLGSDPQTSEKSPAGRTLNRADLARVAGVALTTVDRWIVEGLPVLREGRKGVAVLFDLGDVLAWHLSRDAALTADQRRRLAAARTKIAETEAAKIASEVVFIDDVKALWFEVSKSARDRILAVPNRLAAQLAAVVDSREVLEILDIELRRALEAVASSVVPGLPADQA